MMKSKFGYYMALKRKEAQLSQYELAQALHVSETLVKSWECGETYPNSDYISDICSLLALDEREFLSITKKQAINKETSSPAWHKFLTIYDWTLTICYVFAIFVCMLCDVLLNHTLTWSLIVVVSIAMAYSVTNLSFKFKSHNIVKVLLMLMVLNYLLMIVIKYCLYSSLDLSISFHIVSIAYSSIWLIVLIAYKVRDLVLKSSLILIVTGLFSAFFNPMINLLLYDDMWYGPNYAGINILSGISIAIIGLVILLVRKMNGTPVRDHIS